MEINTQVISNQLDISNKFCIDWSQLGCIAFASGNTINIVDSDQLKVIKTINPYNSQKGSFITKLKWSNLNLNTNKNSYPNLASASDDTISIWNVNESKLVQELIPNEGILKINDMKWLSNTSNKSLGLTFIISLYSNSKLIIWNSQNASKLWTKTFNDQQLINFSLDPHNFLRIAFLSSNFIQFLNIDYQNESSQFQEKSQRKFFLMSNDSSSSSESMGIIPTQTGLDTSSKKSSINLFTSYWKNIKPVDTKSPSQQKLSQNECNQIEFNTYAKDLIFLVYAKEIFIFDLTLNQIISFIQLDKIHSPFLQIYSCSQADVLYTLHENGSVTVHYRQSSNLNYSLISQSEQIRLAKNSNIYGFSVCPNTQKNLCIILNDGRLLKYELFQRKKKKLNEEESQFLFEILDESSIFQKNSLKLMLTSMLNSIPNSSFIIKIGPPLTKKNCMIWQPFLAIGDSNGYLFVYNLNKNKLVRKFMLFTYPILGIEWCSLNSILAWSNSSSSLSNLESSQSNLQTKILVKNEILYTDLRTGESVNFRQGVSEESAIYSAKLSYLRQYLVILFKDQPLEIWDMKNFSLIKKISKKSPFISILEWCPHDFNKRQEVRKASDAKSDTDLNEQNTLLTKHGSNSKNDQVNNSDQKESFICIDSTGLMYSFSVEMNHIKDGAISLPEDGVLVNVTTIALKKDLVLFGDLDGNVTKWNIRTKLSKSVLIKRGSDIKKLKFAPGKENLLLLVQFSDSIQILEVNNLEIYCEFKSKNKILDSYWCSSDKLVISFNDLSIKVFNVNFKQLNDSNEFVASNLFKSLKDENKDTNLLKFKSVLFDMIDRSVISKNLSCEYALKEENLNENLKDLLINKFEKSYLNKIDRFALLNAYFNINSFETKFWALLSNILTNSTNSKFRFVLRQNSFLLNSSEFRNNELELLKFYKEKFDVQSQSSWLLKNFLLFNELDLVFNMLMETESSDENYTNNLIKACLISSLKSSNDNSHTKTSIKLVATNLIANGKISDGIELLCMIGLVFDACRYLQDNNEWEKAAWLAKIRLNDDEYNDVVKRWCEYLCSNQINRKEFAILLLLSCKSYWKCLEVLSDMNYIQLSYLFMKHLIENNLIKLSDDITYDLSVQDDDRFLSFLTSNLELMSQNQQKLTVKKILENYLDFKKLLKV